MPSHPVPNPKGLRVLALAALGLIPAVAGFAADAAPDEGSAPAAPGFVEPGVTEMQTKRLEAYTATTPWGTQRLVAGNIDGRETWHLINTVTGGDSPMLDHIVMDRRTLALMNRHSPYFAVGRHFLAAAIRDRTLTGSLNPIDGGDPLVFTTELSRQVFEESVLGLVLATLPLREGYTATVPRLAISGSTKEFSTGSIALEVTGREDVEGGDGKSYRCWVVNAQWSGVDYSETHWIADQPPYSIRKQARFPNGRKRESGFVSVTRN